MDLGQAFKSITDLDEAPVVIADLDHKIVYLNPSAQERYKKRGGAALEGRSLLECHNEQSVRIIKDTVAWFSDSKNNNKKYTYHRLGCDVYMVAIRSVEGELMGYYEKHESRICEKQK